MATHYIFQLIHMTALSFMHRCLLSLVSFWSEGLFKIPIYQSILDLDGVLVCAFHCSFFSFFLFFQFLQLLFFGFFSCHFAPFYILLFSLSSRQSCLGHKSKKQPANAFLSSIWWGVSKELMHGPRWEVAIREVHGHATSIAHFDRKVIWLK